MAAVYMKANALLSVIASRQAHGVARCVFPGLGVIETVLPDRIAISSTCWPAGHLPEPAEVLGECLAIRVALKRGLEHRKDPVGQVLGHAVENPSAITPDLGD